MFEKIKLFGKAFKKIRKGQKAGLSREETRANALDNIVSDLVSLDPPDIPDAVLDVFEDSYDHLYDTERSHGFTLSAPHIELIQSVRLGWDGTESGSARFDPDRPFTTAAPIAFMRELFDVQDEAEAARHYLEATWAMNAFFDQVEIEPGLYEMANMSVAEVQTQMSGYPGVNATTDLGLTQSGQVDLTADMIAVLKQTRWDWSMHGYEDDFGWPGPAIDPKRPYGDMSNWPVEMASLLKWDLNKSEDGFFETNDEQDAKLQALHMTQLASAQAMLEHGQIPGLG